VRGAGQGCQRFGHQTCVCNISKNYKVDQYHSANDNYNNCCTDYDSCADYNDNYNYSAE
jgi:hypothetical protein